MKKLLFLTSIMLFSLILNAQQLNFYFPNGKKYEGKAETMNALNKELNENYVHIHIYEYDTSHDTSYVDVGFKLFTNIPIWVLTDKPILIQKAIKTFDLKEFFIYDFEMELDQYIKKGILSDIYILKTLGQPDNKSKYSDANTHIELWTYDKFNITLTFKNGIVKNYIKIN